jgi:hypothetical protein
MQKKAEENQHAKAHNVQRRARGAWVDIDFALRTQKVLENCVFSRCFTQIIRF